MWRNRMARYEILTAEDVEVIHEHAMTILEEIGIDFLHERARDLFRQSGMKVEEDRVRLDREFVLEQVGRAPAAFQVQARNPANSLTIGGDHMVTAPVY